MDSPPVPTLKFAKMYDNNGDGIADSVLIEYNRAITGDDSPDSIAVKWGEAWHYFHPEAIEDNRLQDSIFTLSMNMNEESFTGYKNGDAYTGLPTTWYTYIPTEGEQEGKEVRLDLSIPIKDKVGPIVLKAEIGLGSTFDTIFIQLSESVHPSKTKEVTSFVFQIFNDGIYSKNSPSDFILNWDNDNPRAVFLFPSGSSFQVQAGDSVNLAPDALTVLNENQPHLNNPLVRILGRKRANSNAIDLIHYDSKNPPDEFEIR